MIFYLIFLSQILFISWLIPKLVYARMRTIMDNYPKKNYPKLYVGSDDEYNRQMQRYKVINQILMFCGLGLFVAIVLWEYFNEKQISQMVPWAYFMLQMVPGMMLEFNACRSFKLMRAINDSSTKTASMSPRKFYDFVSPSLLYFAIFTMVLAQFLVFYQYGIGEKFWMNFAIMVFSHLFFAVVMFKQIYGKKKDPYQSGQDRLNQIKITVNTIVYVAIAVNVFLAAQMLMKIFDVSTLKPLIMSVYCQFLVLMSTYKRITGIKLEELNFDVYKNEQIEREVTHS